jgi:hypothetical protein
MDAACHFAREQIIEHFRESRTKAGGSLFLPSFFQMRMQRWTPPEQVALEAAIQSLVSEGWVMMKGDTPLLTHAGFDAIYPEPERWVHERIKSYLAKSNAREGHVVDSPAFVQVEVSRWNPRQEAHLAKALDDLVAEGVLAVSSGHYVLTAAGYQAIYR